MQTQFPIPKDTKDLCELIKFINKRVEEIKNEIKKLVTARTFSVGVNAAELQPGYTSDISLMIAYMEYFNRKENCDDY